MRNGAVIAGYFVVAAAFFLLGRFTGSPLGGGPGPAPSAALPESPKSAPVAAPIPPPAAPAAAAPSPSQGVRVDDLRIGGAQAQQQPPAVFQVPPGPPPAPDAIPIPPGTKPAPDASPADGPKDARVIVLEVSDFQCPVCKRAYEPLRNLAKDFPGQVRLVFKQHPLDMHRNAMNAAAASMAAARQGKFTEMADVLFSNQQALTEPDLVRYAQQIGLNVDRFQKDYRDPTIRARAKTESDAAMGLGATGTPSFFVNGRKEVGWASYEAVKQQVENEIKAVDGLMAQGQTLKDARLARVRANLPEAEQFLKTSLGSEFVEP